MLLASVFFASLAMINEFGAIDLLFLTICLLLLVMGVINLGLLFKQIRILKSFSKEEMKEFLSQRMKNTLKCKNTLAYCFKFVARPPKEVSLYL